MKYVGAKVMKRMEMNKLRSNFKETPKTLLLPLSLGVSSVCLLHVLNQQLTSQHERNGTASYKLHVLLIDQSTPGDNAPSHEAFQRLKLRYPSHAYSSASLEDIFDYDIDFDYKMLNVRDGGMALTKQERLKQALASLPSATSRADVENMVRIRLIVAFARRGSCDSIIWGDSTTRLAERTLSETAKGRGGSLPWLTADGPSPYGVKFTYPMRDLLKKELGALAALTSPPLTDIIMATGPAAQVSASSKDTTIDNLMSQFFKSVEENYPSIVANVVRTSGKLVAPPIKADGRICLTCGFPVVERTQKWGGDQESDIQTLTVDKPVADQNRPLCYGCTRSGLNSSEP